MYIKKKQQTRNLTLWDPKLFPQDTEILGWYLAELVLPHTSIALVGHSFCDGVTIKYLM